MFEKVVNDFVYRAIKFIVIYLGFINRETGVESWEHDYGSIYVLIKHWNMSPLESFPINDQWEFKLYHTGDEFLVLTVPYSQVIHYLLNLAHKVPIVDTDSSEV
jgi:hypothetical protein